MGGSLCKELSSLRRELSSGNDRFYQNGPLGGGSGTGVDSLEFDHPTLIEVSSIDCT